MTNSGLRIAPGADGVSIWSSEIFGDDSISPVRDFLSRAFSVDEVDGVELRRAASFGRIRYRNAADPAEIWRKLSRALRTPVVATASPQRVDAGHVYLDGPLKRAVRVSRIGDSLLTWQVRRQSENTLLLSHPVLRNRRDIVFRLEEELAAIFGVEDFRASAITAGVSIRFDSRALSVERLARELEKAWPRLLDGLDGPPSQKRLYAAAGLVGLAFTGQYLVPPLRPLAVASVALYSLPNVVNAAKDLARGRVGLPALYSSGLALMLVSGMPFTSSVMATFMQLWPHLTRRQLVRSQRRLFAAQRRRPICARVPHAEGIDVEVSVDDLRKGDRVIVRTGELVPVDGVVEDGHALLAHPLEPSQAEDISQGDSIAAGMFVRDGTLTIRVERAGAETSASYLASLLPHAALAGMPSSLEAERIANRNAKPALLLAALGFGITRTPRLSQILIRPDYATGPRLSAQLSALHGIARGAHLGASFRNPAALDRLDGADAVVFDESAGLEQKRVEVARVDSVPGVPSELVAGYVFAAHRDDGSEQSRALAGYASKHKVALPVAEAASRRAGVARYRDSRGSAIEVATLPYLTASKLDVPPSLRTTALGRSEARDPQLRSRFVVRDGRVLGVVRFARTGELLAADAIATLKAQDDKARIVYVATSKESQAQAVAAALGIELVYAARPAAKLDFVRGLGGKTIWIGDGGDAQAKELVAASTVSVSVAPLSRVHEDAADILLPQAGLAALPEVIALGRAHVRRLAQDYRTVYAANLLGVTGVLHPRLNALHVGLLSNLGTGVIYARRARELNRLAVRGESERAALDRGALEQ